GGADRPPDGLSRADPLRSRQARRPAPALPRHLQGGAAVRLPGDDRVRGRPEEDHRVVSPEQGRSAQPLTDPILEEVPPFYEDHHETIEQAREAQRYFYGYLTRALQARIPAGQRILDIGCGSGHLLAALRPSRGVGIDVSGRAVDAARKRYAGADLHFV